MIIRRINPMGLNFFISGAHDGDTTYIQLAGTNKSINVSVNIHEFSQMWYDWQQGGQFIQDAFKKLSGSEREFFMTGITPSEWNLLPQED